MLHELIRTVMPLERDSDYAYAWAVDASQESNLRVLVANSLPFPGNLLSTSNTAIIWAGCFEAPLPRLIEGCATVLTEAELSHARQLRHEEDARTYLVAHAGLRLQLARVLSCQPRDLQFDIDRHGKPYLSGVDGRTSCPLVHFNISHSRGRALVGLSTRPIGVDVELVADFPDLIDVARMTFPPESLEALLEKSGLARRRLFYRFWVLGEAFTKATGLGVAQGLTNFAFSSHGTPCLQRVEPAWGPKSRWHFGIVSREGSNMQ